MKSSASKANNELKKIALITEFIYFTGGVEKCILELYKELTSRGIKVDIYAGLYEQDKTFKEFKEIKVRAMLHKKLPSIIHSLYLRHKFANLKLKGYDGYIIFGSHSIAAGKNNHPNVWWSTRPLAYLYGFEGKVNDKDIAYMHNNNLLKKIGVKLYLSYLRIIDQMQIKKVDKILAVGPLAKVWVEKAYPRRKIGLLYQPVKISKYKDLGNGGYYLSVARHVEDKKVDRIVQAFKRMPQKKLYQIGEGINTPKIKELAKSSKNIKLLGFVNEEELPKIVGKSIAMISASENEDFSMNLIESLAAGKPTISTNIDRSVKDFVQTDSGILMPNSQPESIMRAVKMLDEKKAKKMKSAALKKSLLFSDKSYADGFLDALGLK